MANSDQLSEFIAANDAKGFLICYMQCIDEGQNFSVPSSIELSKIKEGWEEILPGIGGGYTEEFIDSLASTWNSTVTKQGAKVTPTFAKEILAILQNKPMPKEKSASTPQTKSMSQVPQSTPTPEPHT